MGGPRSDARGTADRGTDNRLSAPLEVWAQRTPTWSLQGAGAIPDALADALRTQMLLDVEILGDDPERINPLIDRLLATWQFLRDKAAASQRDPVDGALLVTDPMVVLAQMGKSVKIVQTDTGESIPVFEGEGEPLVLEVWAPKEFPKEMPPNQIERYPKRPRAVGELPPFIPSNIRFLIDLYERNKERMRAKKRGGKARAADDPIPIIEEPPLTDDDQKAMDAAFKQLEQKLLATQIDALPTGETPSVDRAINALSVMTLADISRQTGVEIQSQFRDTKLIEGIEMIIYHGPHSVVLDKKGEPSTLNGRLVYPILVPEPGSQMMRDLQPPGLYVSIQRYGFSSFNINANGSIRKLLFGGVGSFIEYGYGYSGPHKFQETIQRYVDFMGKGVFVAGVVSPSAFERQDISYDRVTTKLWEIMERALPYTVAEIGKRAGGLIENYEEFLKTVGKEIIKTLIIEKVRQKAIEFVIKKIGARFVPGVNLAAALYDLFGNKDQIIRIRHAIGCIIMAIRGNEPEDMTISSKVLSKIIADEVEDRVIQELVKRGARRLKKGAPKTQQPDPKAPQSDPKAQGSDPATPAQTPHADPHPQATPHSQVDPATADPTVASSPTAVTSPKPQSDPAAINNRGTSPPQTPHAPPRPRTDPTATNGKGTGSPPPPPAQKKPSDALPDNTQQQVTDAQKVAAQQQRGGTKKPDGTDEDIPSDSVGGKGTDSKGIDSKGTDDGATGQRIGDGHIGVHPNSVEPDAPRIKGEDGEGILRVGESSIGVHGRSDTPVTTRRTRASPGRSEAPPSTGGPMEFQTPIGRAEYQPIGNVLVMSRHPDALVGSRQDGFNRDTLAIIAADQNHPMRALLDETSVGSRKLQYVAPSYGRRGGDKEMWRRHPEDLEAGHARSNKTRDAEVIVMQTRYRNQRNSNLHENPMTGAGDVTMDEVVVVGHIAVEKSSAWDLWEAGYIKLSYDEMLALPTLKL